MAIRIETTEYQKTHGRKPRGEGAWMFDVDGMLLCTPAPMTLTDAKVWAMRELRDVFGVRNATVQVAP